MSVLRRLGVVGAHGTLLGVGDLIAACTLMRTCGVTSDNTVYELRAQQLVDVGIDAPGATFRGMPVTHGVGRLIVPPTPFNDAAGMTGCYVEIASR